MDRIAATISSRNSGDVGCLYALFPQVPGFGVVKQLRSFDLKSGRNTVSFTDVAAFLDPTTVGFSDLTDPRTSVLEQSFQFDLVSPSKLLEKNCLYKGSA